ncbi:putative porin [Brumimicrobium mesophilum]|uniref:putative porin n=1 Tax=Brumimicrobium mesophilum TaxID=392717 RepID=UPI000D140012|nr:putative porin [Brumimicrobium mesophilum]
MKYPFAFIALIFSFTLVGQKEFFYQEMDSIKIGYRSGGTELDSIDASFIGEITLRPGSGFGQLYERNLAENIFLSPASLAYVSSQRKISPKFSGLPYLGFQYAFGSSLTQDLNLEYHQFYRPNSHLHFRYNRRTSNGFLRNGDYGLNDLNLRFFHSKERYSTNFEGSYSAYDIAQNGGISTDSLLDEFEIEFTPVQRENARSVVRKLDLKWDNYLLMVGDSLIGSGFKTKHQYNIVGREYTDQLTDLSVIDTFYIDTSGKTRDQYQTAKFSNGGGVYFNSPGLKIDATINHQYWRNQNLGANRDTNEVYLHSNLFAALGSRLHLSNEFYLNLIGATGEIKNYAFLNYEIFNDLTLKGRLNFENLYPTPYQRFHTANYYQWNIDDLEMQQKLQIGGDLKYGDSTFIQASVLWTSINNGRYFMGNEWRQDTLELISMGSFQLKGGLKLGKWSFYPTATLRFNSANFSFQPIFETMNRITFQTKLFKAQKLGAAFGVDLGYQSGYNYLEYNGVLGLLQIPTTPLETEAIIRLNAFLALSIDEFRFFVKAENLSSLINDPKTRIDIDYPIMPFLIRLGITWDFFN